MLRNITLGLLFLVCFGFYAQTGPGGVGSSANNVLWLDANRGVTTTGTAVTAWADQSGNAFNAAPPTTTARPAFVSNSANGYPTLDFDGTDDQLWVNDNAALDLTQWHFFIVPLIDTQKDYNAFVVKGNDVNENYEMLGFADASMHMPIFYTDASRTFPNSTTSQLTATANIFEYTYSSAVGRDVYRNNNNIYTDNENKTPATNNFSLYIGNERNTTGRFLNGDLAEVIMYNARLNSAQRIIVNNYLAAKYNCTLTANDIYVQDNAANGNFDHDVAGIGRVDASNIQNDSRGSGIVRIINPTGLDNNEYYIWGHNNGVLGAYTTTDYPSGQGLQGRLVRIWRGTEQGAITSFDVRFDLTGLGSVTASHLRLLVDTDNDGTFVDETAAGGGVISGASSLGANIYAFTGVTAMNNNLRFTLGTTSISATPLPIELADFNAIYSDNKVLINWSTVSEQNNDYFTIEKSKDGINYTSVSMIKGTSNSTSRLDYTETDFSPFHGLSYYRLKQTDHDGKISYSQVAAVNFKLSKGTFAVSPNPTDGPIHLEFKGFQNQEILVVIRDMSGKEYYAKVLIADEESKLIANDSENKLPPGTYIVIASTINELYSQKLIIK